MKYNTYHKPMIVHVENQILALKGHTIFKTRFKTVLVNRQHYESRQNSEQAKHCKKQEGL